MTKQEAAQAYLRRDPVLYANLLEALRRGSATSRLAYSTGSRHR